MSSSSESHVTHDLNASPNRYSMVRFPDSAGLLPAIRPDGEWVKHGEAAALIQSQAAEIERLTRENGAFETGLVELHRELSAAEADLARAREHVETLSELLKIIREHWVDYDHVFSIAVHEADQWVARAAAEGREDE